MTFDWSKAEKNGSHSAAFWTWSAFYSFPLLPSRSFYEVWSLAVWLQGERLIRCIRCEGWIWSWLASDSSFVLFPSLWVGWVKDQISCRVGICKFGFSHLWREKLVSWVSYTDCRWLKKKRKSCSVSSGGEISFWSWAALSKVRSWAFFLWPYSAFFACIFILLTWILIYLFKTDADSHWPLGADWF